ncbi:MAG: hypothetical protein PSN34_12325, partial [Urechidicola sp.]|nr:hypothetical protein [Urechidicola sp.]
AEIVVNMNILVRNNISSKLKNSTYAIGYYSYTNRCKQAEKPPHGQAHLVFSNAQSQRGKTKRACPFPPPPESN